MPPRTSKTRRDFPSIIDPDPDPDYFVDPDADSPVDVPVDPDPDMVKPKKSMQPRQPQQPQQVDPNFKYNRQWPDFRHTIPEGHRLIRREQWDWTRTAPDGTRYKEQMKVKRSPSGWLF